MYASLDDLVYVPTSERGRARVGRIVELRHADGTPPYVVEWLDTGVRAVLFPRGDHARDTVVVSAHAAGRSTRVDHKLWTVLVELVDSDGSAHAEAVLLTDRGDEHLVAEGDAGPVGGTTPDEGLAVARALHRLAEALEAEHDVDAREVDARQPDATGADLRE